MSNDTDIESRDGRKSMYDGIRQTDSQPTAVQVVNVCLAED